MVQLQLPEQEKAGEGAREVAEGPLLPTHTQARTKRQAANKRSGNILIPLSWTSDSSFKIF